MRVFIVVVLLGLGLVGCRPSRAALTAGEIGCPQHEISTREDGSSGGLTQSAETWIAECRGRRFVCSEVTTSSSDVTWLFTDATDSVDSDISCREELAAGSAPAQKEIPSRKISVSAPPVGAGGFDFGIDRASAKARCEGAGHRFTEDESAHATCSGTATRLNLPSSTRLSFCAGGLCGITISQIPENGWAAAFSRLDAGLTAKYGASPSRRVLVPTPCRNPEQFDGCVRDGAISFKVSWQWPRGQRLRLSLGKPSASTSTAALELVYLRPAPKASMDVSGL